jgi:hypothetical protein
MKISYVAALLWIALLSWGCASSAILSTGEKTIVRYQQYDGRTGQLTLELVMVEESNQDYENLYSELAANGNIKRVPSEKFEHLVDTLEDLGFVALARPLPRGVPPRRADASKMIVVENTSGQWILNNKDTLSLEEREDFNMMVDLIRNCYDSIFSLQVIQNEEGKNLFIEEQQRLKEQNRNRQRLIEQNEQRLNP